MAIIVIQAHVPIVIHAHKEQHLYYNVVTGRQQPSSMTTRPIFHAPHVRCLSFNPAEVEIPDEVEAKLSPEQ